MDSDGFHQTPMGLFFGMGLSIVCLSYQTFFPWVLSKTHQTPLESCIGLQWSPMESDVFNKIIELVI